MDNSPNTKVSDLIASARRHGLEAVRIADMAGAWLIQQPFATTDRAWLAVRELPRDCAEVIYSFDGVSASVITPLRAGQLVTVFLVA